MTDIARMILDPATGVALMLGPDNPATAGVDLPLGSIYITSTNGVWYSKTGTGITQWTQFALTSGFFPLTGGDLTAGAIIRWSGRSQLTSPSNGQVAVYNNAGSAFSDFMARDLVADRSDGTGVVYLNGSARNRYLYYDGATYQMPGGGLSIGGALLAGGNVRVPSTYGLEFVARGIITSPFDGAIVLSNNAGTSASYLPILQFGGFTSAFPAFRRDGTSASMELVRADQSAYTDLKLNTLSAVGGIVVTGAASTMSLNGIPLSVIRNTSAGVTLQVTNDSNYGHLRISSTGTNLNAYLTLNPTGTGKGIFQVGDTDAMTLTAAGALTFASAVATSTVTALGFNSTGGYATLQNLPGTTSGLYDQKTNAGGTSYIGLESSTGSYLFLGTSAYSAVFGHAGARSLHLVTNNAVRFTIDSAGIATFASTVLCSGGVLWTAASWTRQFTLIDGGALSLGYGGGGNKRWLMGSSGGTLYFGHAADDGAGTSPSYVMTLSSSAGITMSSLLTIPGNTGIKISGVDAGLYQSGNKVYLGSYSSSTYALSIDYTTGVLATAFDIHGSDLYAVRNGALTTGVLYLGNSGSRYLYYDGTNYNMPGGILNLAAVSTSGAATIGTTLGVTGDATFSGYVTVNQSYGKGLVGNYDPTKYRLLYAMGMGQVPPTDGVTLGSMYGLVYGYSDGTGSYPIWLSGVSLGHGLGGVDNGTKKWYIGNIAMWHSGIIYANDFQLT